VCLDLERSGGGAGGKGEGAAWHDEVSTSLPPQPRSCPPSPAVSRTKVQGSGAEQASAGKGNGGEGRQRRAGKATEGREGKRPP